MKVTCSDVRALEDCLEDISEHTAYLNDHRNDHLQPSANVDITTWNLGSSEEGVATVTSGTSDFDRVATAVCFGRIKRYSTTLIAVGSVCCPRSLVPAALEVVGYLSKRQGKQGKSGKA